jgi:hypothetical protein
MNRIKNYQMIQHVYENYRFNKKLIAYQSLGWDLESCFDGFMDNLKKGAKYVNSKVKCIKKISKRERKVYDIIGVNKNHNFIANNMVVHNCDESINFISSEEWSKKENKELKKLVAQIRTKHFLMIYVAPVKIVKIEKNFLESYINYWLEVFGRGKSAMFIKDLTPSQDSWRIKMFQKIESFNEFTSISKITRELAKHPNFWSIIKFPKPPESLYNKYLGVRELNVYNDRNIFNLIDKMDIVRAVLIDILREIITRDSSMSIKRLIMHAENEYGLELKRSDFDFCIEDSKMLITRVKEENAKIKNDIK